MTLEQATAESTPEGDRPPVALVARGIHKSWGPKVVLDDVTLEVPRRSVVWLGGRNGAGKTTLLRIAGGLIMPDIGEVTLDGLSPERDRRAYQSRMGFLSAGNLGLYARLSVLENLDLFARLALIPKRRQREAVERAVERFALGELVRSRSDRLSTGQRQRVRLAISFLHDPEVVLLDEPYTSLDDDGLALLQRALAEVVGRGGAAVWCAPSPEHGHLPIDEGYVIDGGSLQPA